MAELAMLCNDILESLGEAKIDSYITGCKECLISGCDCHSCYDYSISFINLYEAYFDSLPPRILGCNELDFEKSSDRPSYVWWQEVDPSVHIPEPPVDPNNPPPDYLRWEPMLGCYVYYDAYYDKELGMIVLEKWPGAEEIDCLCSLCN